MFFGGYGSGYPATPFEQHYRCYPVSFIEKAHLENGDKVIMPPSALDRLASLHVEYPMLFEITNETATRASHCGVLEFIADEGMIYMPYWMMENLLLQEGDIVKVKSATLPRGSYVKLQPHTKDFLDITNPKAVLEKTLRNFSCLTTGDATMFFYNNKKYYIDIVETRPGNAISIIETDCEVDFAPPLDYKEPERIPKPPPAAPAPVAAEPPEVKEEPEEPKFSAFTGVGRRLDGKGSATPAIPLSQARAASSSGAGPSGSSTASGGSSAAGAAGGSGNCSTRPGPTSQAAGPPTIKRPPGKLVFGSNNAAKKEQQQTQPPQAAKKEEPPSTASPSAADTQKKFQAFSGKGYVLRQ